MLKINHLTVIINLKEIQTNSQLLFWDATYNYFCYIFILDSALINIEKFLAFKICPD